MTKRVLDFDHVIEALRRYSRRERGLVNWPHSTVYDLECAIKIVEDLKPEDSQKETSHVPLCNRNDLQDVAQWHAQQAEYHKAQMAAADVAFPAASLVHAQKSADHTRFSEAINKIVNEKT